MTEKQVKIKMTTLVNKDLYINDPKLSYAGEETT
jgi:hypothetical protein